MHHSRLLLRHIYVFLVSASPKNAETIKFLEIFKKYVSKNKICFCLKKNSNVLLNKKVIFVFHKVFKLDFITLTLPYSYNWKKFNNKINAKRSQEYQSMDIEYVTGKINSCILELLFRRFSCLIFAPSRTS